MQKEGSELYGVNIYGYQPLLAGGGGGVGKYEVLSY